MAPAGDARWVRVAITVPPGLPGGTEVLADRLWAFAPAAIEERTGPDGTVLVAGFGEVSRAEAAAAVATEAGCAPVQVTPVDDHGLDGWRAWAGVERAGPFDIVPSWIDAPDHRAGRIVVRIDPRTTFGSGSHPTTRLVLVRLAALVAEAGAAPARVLDVGCGSGILAVAAARLGARSVTAIDVDAHAPATTAINAARNGVADRISASDDPLAAVVAARGAFDVVVANLLAPVVTDLAEDLVAAVAPAGALVVSGLLADRWEATVADLPGVEPQVVDTDDGWAAITLRRRSADSRCQSSSSPLSSSTSSTSNASAELS
jgi:ribosomal protein L11 methyltransferase